MSYLLRICIVTSLLAQIISGQCNTLVTNPDTGLPDCVAVNRLGTSITLGPSSSTTDIQTALSSLPSGGVVQLSAGTYLISAMLTVPENVKLRGYGRNTILQAVPAFNFSTNTAIVRLGSSAITHGAQIEDLHIHGNDIANSVGVYSAWAQEQSGLSNVVVSHVTKYGIWWDGINTQNSFMHNIDVQTTTGSASTVPIFIDGALSFRGIFGATIIGASGVPVGLRINGLTSGTFSNIHMETVTVGIEIGSSVASDGLVISNVVGGAGVTDVIKLTTLSSRAVLLALTKNGATNMINDVANNTVITDSRVAEYTAGTGWAGPTRIIYGNDNDSYFNDIDLLRLYNSSNQGGAVAGSNFTVSASGDVLGYNQSSNAIVPTYNASSVTKYSSARPALVVRVLNQGSTGDGSVYEILTAPVGSTTLVSRFKILADGTVVQRPPTSCAGLTAGTLWNDSGTAKICP